MAAVSHHGEHEEIPQRQAVQVQEERAHPSHVQRLRRRAERGGDVAGLREHQAARRED